MASLSIFVLRHSPVKGDNVFFRIPLIVMTFVSTLHKRRLRVYGGHG